MRLKILQILDKNQNLIPVVGIFQVFVLPFYLLAIEFYVYKPLTYSLIGRIILCYGAYLLFFLLQILRRMFDNHNFREYIQGEPDPESWQFNRRIGDEIRTCSEIKSSHNYYIFFFSVTLIIIIADNFRNGCCPYLENIIRVGIVILIIIIYKLEVRKREKILREKYNIPKNKSPFSSY